LQVVFAKQIRRHQGLHGTAQANTARALRLQYFYQAKLNEVLPIRSFSGKAMLNGAGHGVSGKELPAVLEAPPAGAAPHAASKLNAEDCRGAPLA